MPMTGLPMSTAQKPAQAKMASITLVRACIARSLAGGKSQQRRNDEIDNLAHMVDKVEGESGNAEILRLGPGSSPYLDTASAHQFAAARI